MSYKHDFTSRNNYILTHAYDEVVAAQQEPTAANISAQAISDGYPEFIESICQVWLDADEVPVVTHSTLAQIIQRDGSLMAR